VKKLFAVIVLGSLVMVGCEKPASTKAPSKSGTGGASGATGEADKMKADKMAKEASDKAKADAEKAKAEAEKKATDPKADTKDKDAKDTKDPKKGDK
jgi:hypothetical protein